MHQITFYPVGNGDTTQIVLENGKRILLDFRHQKQGENEEMPAIDLSATLKDELTKAQRNYFDIVAFTHGDRDHIDGSTEFFELLHADKYQGEGRIEIKELWVPAAMILDTATNDEQGDEFVIWRQEARYRLAKGKGIRVFSKPEKLKKFLNEKGLTVSDRRDQITDAGTLVPNLSLVEDGVEFFCHSPFIKHVDDSNEMRNEAALIFQVRFKIEETIVDYFAIGDTESDVLADIVETTEKHENEDRLKWDILNIPHHCSYLALSSEKGDSETVPNDAVKRFLEHGQKSAYMISSSHPINSGPSAYNETQPPHVQAKNCYQSYLKKINGRKLLVTMEEPSKSKPEPIVFELTENGVGKIVKNISGAATVVSNIPPRAG